MHSYKFVLLNPTISPEPNYLHIHLCLMIFIPFPCIFVDLGDPAVWHTKMKTVLLFPTCSDFKVSLHLPQFGGNHETDGTVKMWTIVKMSKTVVPARHVQHDNNSTMHGDKLCNEVQTC